MATGRATLLGFPDYRKNPPREIAPEDDRRLAEELDRAAGSMSFAALVELFYRLHPPARPELHARHQAHFLFEAAHAQAAMQRLAAAGPGALLDVGCGMGRYLAAAARAGRRALGVDVAVYQLVLARKLLEEEGVEAELCLANAEALPYEAASFGAAVGTDLLEHVDEPGATVAEVGRLLRPGGRALFTTPNRFSLTAEPHVGVWGLGYLPRPWAERLVERRLGVDYRPIRPLALGGLRRLMQENFPGEFEIELPQPGAEELRSFSAAKRAAARAYSALSQVAGVRGAVRVVAPYFVVAGRRN